MHNQIVRLLSAFSLLPLLVLSATAQVTITEFLASNSTGIRDEDNSFSDWVELHNSSATNVNIGGWYLTDSASNLTKWRIPSTNMAPRSYLIIFTDGKDRSVPGARLHANFNLSAGGEYLALVKPDGVTIASQFAPQYPGQAPDVSYGIGTLTTNTTVINTNTLVRVRVPAAGEGTNWTTVEYADSTWALGTNGIGYGTTNSVAVDHAQSVLPTAPVVYYRLNEASGTAAANIGSSGSAQNGTYNSTTLGTAGPRPPAFNGFELDNNAPTFTGASHVAGPSGFFNNRNAFTVGGWIRPTSTPAARTGLFGQNDCVEFGFISGNTLECWTPGGGSLTGVPYPFPLNEWHHVVGVADGTSIRIFIDGVQVGSGGGATANYGSSTFGFNIGGGGVQDGSGNFFPGQIDEVVAYHRALSNAEILALYRAGTNGTGTPASAFVRTDVSATMSNVNASAYVRIPFTITNPTNVTELALRMRYDDGFVAYVNGQEVARVNAPETPAYNSVATNGHSPLTVDEFRFAGTMLVAGTNILAIQGLNLAANDEDFLLGAELNVASALGAGSVPLYFTVPSPGAANSGGVANPGPAIVSPSHFPVVPKDSEDLAVTARVTPTFFPISSVVMRYRVMFGAEVELPMADDGAHGDGAANDGVYGAIIPASAATNAQMIRWFFRATDTLNNTSRWPVFVNRLESEEYLGTMVEEPNVTSKLPIYHLFVAQANLGSIDTEPGGRVSVFYDGELYDNVRMSLRGNTSASQTKKSHRFEFNREHPFRHHPDYPRIRKTSLMAEFLDPAYLRQHLSFWLLDLMGVPSPFFYPVRAQMNGAFYALTYHNDVIDEEQVERMGYDPRGTLYKAAGNILPSQSSTGVFEKKTEPLGDHTEYQTFVRAINETNTVANRRAAAFDMMDIPEVINYLAGARWNSENDDVWANMSIYRDTYGDQLWRIIPFDMNASWGQRYGGITPLDSTNDACKSHPLYGGSTIIACDGGTYNRIYDTVIALPELRQMLLRRMRTVLDRWILEPGVEPQSRLLETHIRHMTNLIWTEAFMDRARWGYSTWTASNKPLTNAVNELFNEFINPRRNHWNATHSITNTAKAIGINRTDNAGIPGSQPPNPALYLASVDVNPSSRIQGQEFLSFTNPNPIALDISGWQVDGAVEFTFKQGTIIPSNGVVYLSPDIPAFRNRTTGPRGGQGLFVVGPYRGSLDSRGEAIQLFDDAGRLVHTNAIVGTPSLAQQYLRVTEVMYAPAATNVGSLYGREDFEYIELKNIGPVALNLVGVHFTNGIEFAFATNSTVTNLAPGQIVVLVRNALAFSSRYGGGTIAGTFTGALDNSGDRIKLDDASGEEILDFTYNNTWYPITDGLGFSLVIVDENAPHFTWDQRQSWRPSGTLNGSGGQNDPAQPSFATVLVNEVLANSDPGIDSIELWNPSTNAANVSHWWISDDFNSPQKYRIAADTVIPAGGYLVLSETQFNPGGAGFSFSAGGDEAYVFSGDAGGQLTGYFHGFDYNASEPNISWGRYVTSNGRELLVPQSAQTFNATNAGPRVGPIVISEVMYHPPDLVSGDDSASEYIELHNISASPVTLAGGIASSNRWRLDDAVNFSFATNTTLPAGGFLLVVSFDPATNATALAAFRAKYGLDNSVAIVGPWNGQLDNSEDDVELKKPDLSVTTNITSVLVERVHYDEGGLWPGAADGFGPALIRIVPGAFGDDSTNWLAGAPTPGAASIIAPPPVITSQPTNVTIVIGQSANFSVTATGTGLAFQWFRDGTAVPGATGAVLNLTGVQLTQAGTYSVMALSGGGAVLSSNAELTVLSPVAIVSQPQSQIVAPGTNVTVSVGAIGNGTLRYQWRFEGVDIANATNASYSFLNANVDQHHGNFSVVIRDDVSTITSSNALIFLRVLPTILVQPTPATVAQGQTARFSALAAGAPPLSFRWLRNGVTWPSDGTATLIITNCQSNGTFRVVVTNLAGSVNSSSVALTVLPDSDQDGIPDVWETAYFGTATGGSGSADSDGDGMSNTEEFGAGTDPTNSLSVLRLTVSPTNQAILGFVAQTNRGYSLQYRTNLQSAAWRSVTNVAISTQVRNISITAPTPAPEPERFYRVITPPEP